VERKPRSPSLEGRGGMTDLDQSHAFGALKPLGVARDYPGFHALLRARVAELGITLDSIDESGLLPDKFASKALGVVPARHVIGPVLMGSVLEALGIVVVICECPRARAKASRRWQQRQEKYVAPRRRTFQEFMLNVHVRKLLAAHLNDSLTPEQRRERAKRAARARWSMRGHRRVA
jgi:hypothetical protein